MPCPYGHFPCIFNKKSIEAFTEVTYASIRQNLVWSGIKIAVFLQESIRICRMTREIRIDALTDKSDNHSLWTVSVLSSCDPEILGKHGKTRKVMTKLSKLKRNYLFFYYWGLCKLSCHGVYILLVLEISL